MINNKKGFLLNLFYFYIRYLTQKIVIIENKAGLKFEGKISILSIILEKRRGAQLQFMSSLGKYFYEL